MKTPTPSLLLAGASLAFAAPGQFSARHNTPLLKRTGYDLCENDCNLAGLAYPDKHTLQLALENNWSEQCPPIYFGADPNAPTASSRVCLDVVGSDVVFNFESFPGYTYSSASVTWKLKGNVLTPASWTAPPPTSSIACGPDPSSDGLQCKLPFSSILGVSSSTSVKDLLSGMCPNGDREGLVLYLEFSGVVTSTTNTPASATFTNEPPCTARDSTGGCTARDTAIPYIEMVYRCSKCNRDVCPPVEPPAQTTCGLGTAFGYREDKSITLNTQNGQGCKRWGWYSTPTLAELQAGAVSGTLLVGAGGNDVSKAINVGTFVATADATGKVTVTYLLNPRYALTEAHVDIECLPIDKCAPGQYSFKVGGLKDLSTYSTGLIKYPTCSSPSKAALIVHAAVDVVVQGTACPAKVE